MRPSQADHNISMFLTGAGLKIYLAFQNDEQPYFPLQGESPVAVITTSKEKQTGDGRSNTRAVASCTLFLN